VDKGGRKIFEVVYYPMCGNSKTMCNNTIELAQAIAAELDIEAEAMKIKEELLKDSFVFLGCGCFANKSRDELRQFITRNDFKNRRVALFGTSAGDKVNKVRAMEELLKPAGALIRGSFYCKRIPLPLLHRGHPNNEELTKAREFANEMKKP